MRRSLLLAFAVVACRRTPPPAPAELVVEPPAWHAVDVARVSAGEPVPNDTLLVQLDGDGVRIAGGSVVVPAPPRERWPWGFEASHKARSDSTTLYLPALASALTAKLDGGATSDVVLVVDRSVPYRMVTEVLFTLGQSCPQDTCPPVGFAVSIPNGRRAMLPIQIPRAADMRKRFHIYPDGGFSYSPPGLLGLTALVVPDGIALKARGGNVAPGCDDLGPGVAIPKPDAGTYDLDAFSHCLGKLRGASPDFAGERTITFAAPPPIPMGEVLQVMATARRTEDGGSRFDEQSLGIPR